MAVNYSELGDQYWADARHAGMEGISDPGTLAEEILLSCAGARVLDIGAGKGQLVHALLRLGVNAEGVDVSQQAVEVASAGAPHRFHAGSVLALPFGDDSFDTLIANNVLECLSDTDVPQALREMARVTCRTVYLRVATSAAADGDWHRTVQPRGWWEQRFFEAGFRKHPSYYQVNDYEALEQDGTFVTIVLERLPAPAAALYPLSALVAERDLHMDMLRESGSRSDAHVARYQWAAQYIRPGDTVLDAACGLGYGSYLLQSASTAASTLGIDGSAYAYDYAEHNFAAALPGLAFRCGMLPEALADIADHSVDVVVSFETLEHIDANVATLAEFHRILTPGGRIITSVPNDWSDASGEDPNPFHVHVYTLERLYSELERHFTVETLVAQTANQYKVGTDRVTWHAAGRSLREVPLTVRRDGGAPPAEWWLAVAMRPALEGAGVPYRESQYPRFDAPAWNVTTYGRDYDNPWLVRSMVDTGHRLREEDALTALAEAVCASAAPDAPDRGAALCVLAYQLLASGAPPTAPIDDLAARIEAYMAAGPATPHGQRWTVSLLFALAKLWLGHGDFTRARTALERCVSVDALAFSPLLCNRTVEAHLLLGSLEIAAGAQAAAVAHWRAGIAVAQRAVLADWTASVGDVANPAEFGLPELASVLEYASSCAYALAHAGEIAHKPWWWLHPRRDRLSQAARVARQLQHTQLATREMQGELTRYTQQAAEFVRLQELDRVALGHAHGLLERQAAELEAYGAQTDALQGELSAYARQAAEYVRQQEADRVALHQAHALLAQQAAELQAYASQAAEYARLQELDRAALDHAHGLLDQQALELQAYQKQAVGMQGELMRYSLQTAEYVRLQEVDRTALVRQHGLLEQQMSELEANRVHIGELKVQIAAHVKTAQLQQQELAAYRTQAEEFAKQVRALQDQTQAAHDLAATYEARLKVGRMAQ